jgi:hypothetical protein
VLEKSPFCWANQSNQWSINGHTSPVKFSEPIFVPATWSSQNWASQEWKIGPVKKLPSHKWACKLWPSQNFEQICTAYFCKKKKILNLFFLTKKCKLKQSDKILIYLKLVAFL